MRWPPPQFEVATTQIQVTQVTAAGRRSGWRVLTGPDLATRLAPWCINKLLKLPIPQPASSLSRSNVAGHAGHSRGLKRDRSLVTRGAPCQTTLPAFPSPSSTALLLDLAAWPWWRAPPAVPSSTQEDLPSHAEIPDLDGIPGKHPGRRGGRCDSSGPSPQDPLRLMTGRVTPIWRPAVSMTEEPSCTEY